MAALVQQMMTFMAHQEELRATCDAQERRKDAAQKREEALLAARERHEELAQMRADALAAAQERREEAAIMREERRDETARLHDLLTQVIAAKSDPVRPLDTTSSSLVPTPVTDHQTTHLEKVAFSKYDGKMDATAIHSWLHQFTAYFATRKMTSHDKVLSAAVYLSGDAITWYQAWQEEQLAEHLAGGWDDELLKYD